MMDNALISMATMQHGASQMDAVKNRAKTLGMSDKDVTKAREAAESFEAVFLNQMMQPLFASLSTDGLMGGGPAEGMFRSMMVDEMTKSVASSGGIGIADRIFTEIIKMQEISNAS